MASVVIQPLAFRHLNDWPTIFAEILSYLMRIESVILAIVGLGLHSLLNATLPQHIPIQI